MARSGINIRVRRLNTFTSQDVIYDLTDNEFKSWVLSKMKYAFKNYTLSAVERYKVIEDMQERGVPIYIDESTLVKEDFWNNSLEKTAQP
jgi:hypothetical protein